MNRLKNNFKEEVIYEVYETIGHSSFTNSSGMKKLACWDSKPHTDITKTLMYLLESKKTLFTSEQYCTLIYSQQSLDQSNQ